jgi:hypothetical protein
MLQSPVMTSTVYLANGRQEEQPANGMVDVSKRKH